MNPRTAFAEEVPINAGLPEKNDGRRPRQPGLSGTRYPLGSAHLRAKKTDIRQITHTAVLIFQTRATKVSLEKSMFWLSFPGVR